jgi:hypothetical protein
MKNEIKICLIMMLGIFLILFSERDAVADTTNTSDDFEYEVTTDSSNEKYIYITDYLGDETDVVIPAVIDGIQVKGIGEKAFYEKTQITAISLPANIEWISEYAFAKTSIETITLPEGIEKIYSGAFYGCQNLKEIKIPASLNELKVCKFTTGRVVDLGTYTETFLNCPSLVNIQVDEDNLFYSSVDGVLFNKDKTELIFYPEGKKETKYTIPNTVKKIEGKAFYYSSCTNLTELVFPASIEGIGYEAFGYHLPSTIKDIYYGGSGNDWNTLRSDWYQPLRGATVHYRDGMTSKQCSSIDTVTLSCTQYTYDGKEKCPTVTVKDINGNIVSDKYYTLTYKNNINAGDADTAECIVTFCENYSGYITKYFTILPGDNSVKTVAKNTVVTDSKNKCQVKVVSVDDSNPTVAYKKNLNATASSVVIPDTVKINDVTYKVTSVLDGALKNNKKVANISVGKNVTSIGKNAFKNCKKLKTVTLKATNLQSIGANAFCGDKNLKTITIKSSKLTSKSVGKNAFKGTNKKLTIKAPKKKVSAYKKLLKSKGNQAIRVK